MNEQSIMAYLSSINNACQELLRRVAELEKRLAELEE